MRKIILASSSPRRKQLLGMLGLPFIADPSNYEEDMSLKLAPLALAEVLSAGKTLDVAKRHKNAIVIGADTFIAHKDKILGKPYTPKKARKMLRELSGTVHSVITGFTIIDTKSGKKISKAVETKVYFKKLADREINNYIKTGEPLDKAGAYGIQDLGAIFIRKMEGEYFNVVGLPLFALAESLKEFGIFVL